MDPDSVYSNISDSPGSITGEKHDSHEETKTVNIYQTLKPPGVCAASPAWRDSLRKRTSLLFISLWLITLISLITTLGLHFKQSSALQSELKEQQRNSSTLITELQKQLGEKEQENSQLQKLLKKEQEFSQLQAKYNSEICSSKDTYNTVRSLFAEWSRRDGVITKPVWGWIGEAAVDVTLDPDTAHPRLILSEDGKQVRHGDTRQNRPDTPKRFNYIVCVLGKEGFSSGRFYYEVQVGEKTAWTLGVAKESINRKGKMNPGNGYWTVSLRNGTEYRAIASTSVLLPLREKPRTVGVYVDYERGQVSFYNVEARSHICSFTGYTFTEKLYPFFCPSLNHDGKNSAPLVISSVKSHSE
ncbi:hypothetical protein AGOR_G00186980 [Albula goreensis]|uniref:B30.2/SPRY domain-containing protein n=1 Tax=Albula goreensis TaxID=1534307 RepID=A0A8T3D1C0_9TELE|nr:hypothetical protein AGOR_G00186980 [Albula goreensis]